MDHRCTSLCTPPSTSSYLDLRWAKCCSFLRSLRVFASCVSPRTFPSYSFSLSTKKRGRMPKKSLINLFTYFWHSQNICTHKWSRFGLQLGILRYETKRFDKKTEWEAQETLAANPQVPSAVPWLEGGVLCAASAPDRTNHSMMSK